MTLLEIRQNLNEFEVVHCGLKHERVKLDSKTHLPEKTGALNEEIYKRINLCSLKDRNQRLGCAHSSANNAFSSLIDELSSKDPLIKRLKKQLDELVFNIYMLDHKKGDLEKKFAETIEANNSCESSSAGIEKELDTCIQIHNKYINQLRNIKSDIVQHIDVINRV